MVEFSSLYLPNITSAMLGWALDKLTDFFVKEILLLLGAKDVMKRLERTLLRVHAMLKNLDLEIGDKEWEIWLEDVKDAAYEADDLLDEIFIFASQRRQADTTQVRAPTSGIPPFISAIPHKMDALQKKLDAIAKEMEHLGTTKLVRTKQFKMKERLATGSIMHDPHVFGRNDEISLVKSLLLPDESSAENVSVVPVVGMAGIGKTTIAQLVYNDPEVCTRFELRMWVSVQQEFDVRKLTKSIIESSTDRVVELIELDPLQVKLKKLLQNKRFLLVLDDVWSESYSDWDVLQAPFRVGAKGSSVLVTTRSRIVAKIMNASPPVFLSRLSNDDCWLLFQRRAFGSTNLNIHPNLVAIGREIVKKCNGLPLAVKTLGSLLNSRRDEDEWNIVLRNQIWDFSENESDILPALRLSYQYLPAHLKQCFVYSAIFPKGHKFDKEKLVMLWMAEGFVQPKGGRRMQDLGSEYFDNLLHMSFFEDAHDDVNGLPRYVMHDLVHDMAKFVSNNEYFIIRDDGKLYKPDIPTAARYLSFLIQSGSANILDTFTLSPSIRTMLLLNETKDYVRKLRPDLFDQLGCLRVLDLSSTCITDVPSSIGKLKHLRYLDLSHTLIKTLPKNVRTLHSLQTLNLRGCIELLGLPKEVSNLINLRHLDMDGNRRVNSMPAGIGKLTCLQTLTAFVAGKENGWIGELKDMRNLQTLSISKLENVVTTEASKATLSEKEYLQKLKLQWSVEGDENVAQQVLAGLRPHKNIKELQIELYGGAFFPGWMGDPSFSALIKLSLNNCRKCKLLPPLGQLPSLKSLHIANMPALQHVDEIFSGTKPVWGSPSQVRGFQSLELLKFDNLAGLRKWDVKEGDMPRLRQLIISGCFLLTTLPTIQFLGSLENLEISHCYQFQELPHEIVPMSLKSLAVKSCPLLRSWYANEGSASLQAMAHNKKVTIDGEPQC